MTARDRFRVVHTCLRPTPSLGTESEFPKLPSKVGILVEIDKKDNRVIIECHTPYITSLVTGEDFIYESASKLDATARASILTIAERCEQLGNYLLSESKRLEELVESEKEISAENEVEDRNVYDCTKNASSAPSAPSTSKNRASKPRLEPVLTNDDRDEDSDLDLFR